jgi:peroxiredoxin
MRYHFLLIFFLSVLVLISPPALAGDTAPVVGKPAPHFELPDLSGKTVRLTDFKGRAVLLNFWATWCGPCTAEMPSLNALAATFKDKGLVVLAVSVDSSTKPVRNFLKKPDATLTVLMDSDKEVFFDLYAVMGLPTSFLIDGNGVIVEKFIGERDWNAAEIRNSIADIVRKK